MPAGALGPKNTPPEPANRRGRRRRGARPRVAEGRGLEVVEAVHRLTVGAGDQVYTSTVSEIEWCPLVSNIRGFPLHDPNKLAKG